jgi:hypothetical protein
MKTIFNDDEDNYSDELDDTLRQFELPSDIDQKRVVLQIMDSGGNIEDIIFDIEEIYNYVRNVYKNCPERN